MKTRVISYLFWILSTGIILLDKITALEITNIKVYYSLLIITISLFAIIIIRFWLKFKGEALLLSTAICVTLLFAITYVFTWRLEWKTETILYQNLHLKNRTIEFQRVDLGALGSSSRTIDRIILLPYFEWNEEVKINKIDTITWKEVDIDKT